ncbi:MAG TPA: pyridoxal-phosphate dependent enzyme [Magnetospirillaceae bacterium]|nr:pyridoxal-phosphate dependent enzyme [Magnetospirillaceae bacterium]
MAEGADTLVSAGALQSNHCRQTAAAAAKYGLRCVLIPYGGSSPVGALAYAFALEELLIQVRAGGTGGAVPDCIVFGTSSGGTHAGLVLGKRLHGFAGELLGISIDESESWLRDRVSALAMEASVLLGDRIELKREEIRVSDAYCQAGYGVLTEAEREAVSLFGRAEGLILDPVYTGRAAAGLVDLISRGYFRKDQTVVFWHTGGQPALFADRYADL